MICLLPPLTTIESALLPSIGSQAVLDLVETVEGWHLLEEAVAAAFGVSVEEIREANMLLGDIGRTLGDGISGALSDLSALASSIGARDWFDGDWESNCIFVPRSLIDLLPPAGARRALRPAAP